MFNCSRNLCVHETCCEVARSRFGPAVGLQLDETRSGKRNADEDAAPTKGVDGIELDRTTPNGFWTERSSDLPEPGKSLSQEVPFDSVCVRSYTSIDDQSIR